MQAAVAYALGLARCGLARHRRHPSVQPGAMPRGRGDLQSSANRGEPVGDALDAAAHSGCGRVESNTIVRDAERQLFALVTDAHPGSRRTGVLGDVLQCFQYREIQGRLYVLAISAEPGCFDSNGDCGLSRLRLERSPQPKVGQQWRIDAVREVAQIRKRLLSLTFGVGQEAVDLVR